MLPGAHPATQPAHVTGHGAGGFEAAGYAVLAAATAEEALRLLAEHGPAVRALVADVILDQTHAGWEVARRAREIVADMAVVYLSGGAWHEWEVEGVPGSVLLLKPTGLTQALVTVARLLALPRPPQPPA